MKTRYFIPIYVLLYIGIFILSISYFYTTNDDSFITARYAKNLSEGFGLVSNPFGPTQEGYSNLTLVLLEAFLYKFFSIDFLVGAKIVGITSVFLSCIVSGGILKIFLDTTKQELEAHPESVKWLSKKNTFHILNLLLTASIASSTWFLFWSTQGLETILQAALLLTTAYVFLKVVVYEKYHMLLLASVMAFLTLNTRPEGVMTFILLLILIAGWYMFTRKPNKKLLKSTGIYALLSAVLVSLLFAWKIMYFGDIVPNPTHVKMAVSGWNRDLSYVQAYFSQKGIFFALTFLASFGYATWYVLKNAFQKTRLGKYPKTSIVFLTLLGFVSSQIFFIFVSGGDYMPYGRFFQTHYPFLILLMFVSAIGYGLTLKNTKVFHALFAFILVVSMHSGLVKEDVVNMRWWDLDFIGVDKVHELHNTVHHRTVNSLNEFMEGKSGYFASSEFGYIAYHVNTKGLDIIGLNQKEIARNFKLYGVHEALYANRDYILSKRPRTLLSLNVFRNEKGEVVINPGQAWFLKPYYQSDFFMKHYDVIIPEGKESEDWLLNNWNETYVPVRSLTWDDLENQSKLLYGFFNKETEHRWMKPIARVLLRPEEKDHTLVFKGMVPDINLYPNQEVEVQLKVNGEATGDLAIAKEVIRESGEFTITAPWMFDCPCEDSLITITTSPINTGETEKRDLSIIFRSIGFSAE